MTIAFFLAATVAMQAAPAQNVEVAYVDMTVGRSEAAIDRMAQTDQRDAENPARLINLGIAHARLGNIDQARRLFERAAASERFRLEVASGEWQDSRELARHALAMLGRGDFAQARFAAR